MHWY